MQNTFLPLKVLCHRDQPARYIFVKQHSSETAQRSADTSVLFVTGIPRSHPDPEEGLKEAFAALGPVDSVTVHPSKASHCPTTAPCQRPQIQKQDLRLQLGRTFFFMPTSSPVAVHFC